jgi:hypothetical protein
MSGQAERSSINLPEFWRLSRLVRSLLSWTFLSIFSLLPACVLPIGPDFQDPPPVPNYPPYFAQVGPNTPLFGSTVAISDSGTTFEVIVADPNPGDTLSVRWVSDYPIYTARRTNPIQEQDMKQVADPVTPDAHFTVTLNCVDDFAGGGDTLAVIASDRGFASDLATVQNPEWRYNYDSNGELTLVMGSWIITGCP